MPCPGLPARTHLPWAMPAVAALIQAARTPVAHSTQPRLPGAPRAASVGVPLCAAAAGWRSPWVWAEEPSECLAIARRSDPRLPRWRWPRHPSRPGWGLWGRTGSPQPYLLGSEMCPGGAPAGSCRGPGKGQGGTRGKPAQRRPQAAAGPMLSDAEEISSALALPLWALCSRLCLAHAVLAA